MVDIKVKLFAYFREGRFKEAAFRYEEGTTPGRIVTQLGIDPDDVGVIMVNNRQAGMNTVLNDGDTVAIFPKIGGG
ncbi:MoaD/ThiS family protein [Desulfolithobacter sp.]